ncbi:hypothetical protein VULLAG_LOCUS10545 [Vulpes lagopus]
MHGNVRRYRRQVHVHPLIHSEMHAHVQAKDTCTNPHTLAIAGAGAGGSHCRACKTPTCIRRPRRVVHTETCTDTLELPPALKSFPKPRGRESSEPRAGPRDREPSAPAHDGMGKVCLGRARAELQPRRREAAGRRRRSCAESWWLRRRLDAAEPRGPHPGLAGSRLEHGSARVGAGCARSGWPADATPRPLGARGAVSFP